MLVRGETYAETCRLNPWRVPARFNMGVDVGDRPAEATPDRVCLTVEDEAGRARPYTCLELRRLADRFANVLVGRGLSTGDRVAIVLSQSVETAAAHIGAWKAGMISIPMFTLFGEDALEYRLSDSGARCVVTDAANWPKIAAIRDRLPDLRLVLIVGPGPAPNGTLSWDAETAKATDRFTAVDTDAEDPALIIYTSGTTGNPKGALHAHRTMIGHLPGIEFPHEFFPQAHDRMWTPADWAWIGGLMNVLMGSLHHGVPVIAKRARKFDPEQAFDLMARHGVRNTFMPPTALRLMRQVENPRDRFAVRLRTVAVAGEPMGAELLEWAQDALGVTLNEFYGQTECNLVVANCATLLPVKPGSMGVSVPGHDVRVLAPDGTPAPADTPGRIAVRQPDPVTMLRYWNNPDATKAKYQGEWLLTGDEGRMDADGYLWFVARDDDVITSAGYRIGPGEIEDCLTRHPAVSLAAVVGVPDALRTESVKAFIVLKHGHNRMPGLEDDIRAFVKTRLSPHEYPRLIEFVPSLPLTATGKVRRKDLRDAEIAKAKSSATKEKRA